MQPIYLSIALMIFGSQLLAQKIDVSFGKPQTMPFNGYTSSIEAEQMLMLLKTDKLGSSIEVYSTENLTLTAQHSINDKPSDSIQTGNSNLVPLKLVKLANEPFVVLSDGAKSKSAIKFYLQKTNWLGQMMGAPTEVGQASLLDSQKSPNIEVATSPDGSKLGIVVPMTVANTNNSMSLFMVYDIASGKTTSMSLAVPAMNRYFNIMKCLLTDNGDFIAMTQRLLLTDELVKGTSRNDFRIYVIQTHRQKISDFPVAFNGKDITSINGTIDHQNKQFICSGLSSTINNRYDGDDTDNYYWMTIDLETLTVAKQLSAPLPSPLIAETNDKKANKLIKGEGISNAFKLLDMITFNDGSRMLVYERFFSATQTVYISANPATNHPTATDHYYKTIVAMRFDATNQLINYTVVPKDQFSRDDRAYAYSVVAMANGSDVLLFFNDHLDNVNIKPDDKHVVDRLEDPTQSGLFCITINKNGTVTKQLVYNNREDCKTIIPQRVFINNGKICGLYTTSTSVNTRIPHNNIGLYKIEVLP